MPYKFVVSPLKGAQYNITLYLSISTSTQIWGLQYIQMADDPELTQSESVSSEGKL